MNKQKELEERIEILEKVVFALLSFNAAPDSGSGKDLHSLITDAIGVSGGKGKNWRSEVLRSLGSPDKVLEKCASTAEKRDYFSC